MGGNRSFSRGEGGPGSAGASQRGEPGGSRPFDISHAALDDGTVVVTIQGELDLASAPRMKRGLSEVLATGSTRVVLDIARVSFIDSTALGVLVGIQRHLAEGARMAIAGADTDVINVFELTGLDATFDMFATIDQALGWLRGSEAATG